MPIVTIRAAEDKDFIAIEAIHQRNELPSQCLPEDLKNPLFIHKAVVEHDGKVAMACFLKGVGELYFFVDHEMGTPEERWQWLQLFRDYMFQRAWELGLDQMMAFVPPTVEKNFADRLETLGFRRGLWTCYTLPIS